MAYETLADEPTVKKTMEALSLKGVISYYVPDGAAAKKKLFELLPQGASVMNNTSTTLETIGAVKELLGSSKYDALRNKLLKMDMKTQKHEMLCIGSVPDWSIGSVHAITQNGEIMLASASGSQLAAYAYTASNIVWVAGTHKIVKDIDEGFKRIYERCLPLENVRAQKAYGSPSSVNKMLIINKEPAAGRMAMILVNEVLGF